MTKNLTVITGVLALALAGSTLRAQPDPIIQRMTDSVSLSSLKAHIQTLELAGGNFSRVNFTPGNDTAAIYLKMAFDAIPGLTSVVFDTFYIPSATGGRNTKALVNIVATLQGTDNPPDFFVAGAHYDCSGSRMGSSAWNSQWQTMLVPGADDNATGVASILEMARIMSDPSFGFAPRATIKFVAFGAEETGPSYTGSHIGSKHFADGAANRGEQIIGMVSIDMIGYNPSHLFQSIIANRSSSELATSFAAARARYVATMAVSVTTDTTANYSDHDSFWKNGFPAICLIENAPPWNSNGFYQANPFYHKSSDTSGTVNLELVRQVTQMSIAAVATIASAPTAIRENTALSLPRQYELLGNYPNPFNPSTIIRYGLPVRSRVAMGLFDALGRRVATLLSTEQEPGYHEVRLDGAGLASGVYFCRMQAGPAGGEQSGSIVETRKLLLLR